MDTPRQNIQVYKMANGFMVSPICEPGNVLSSDTPFVFPDYKSMFDYIEKYYGPLLKPATKESGGE